MTPGASPPDVCPRGRGDGQALWDGANPGETPISGPITPDPNTPRLLVSGPLLFQHLDLLVRDSSYSNKAGLGRVGDIIQVRGAEGGDARGLGGHWAEGEGRPEGACGGAKNRSLVPSSEVSPSVSQKSFGKYPKVQELLQGRRARCYLLPAPGRRWASKGHGSPCGERPRGQGLPSLPSSGDPLAPASFSLPLTPFLLPKPGPAQPPVSSA